jgi:hypothetical protein
MFAANRTAKVAGRINELTVSIKTITAISAAGVPNGTKCAITLLNWNNLAQIIEPSHKGKESDKVKTKCLEGVKIKGNKPKKLHPKIKKKYPKKTKVVPGIAKLPKTANSSAISRLKMILIAWITWFPASQKPWGSKIKPPAPAIQLYLILKVKILELGSKDENRFPIK